MNLPNFITLVRIFLVPFFFTELVSIREGHDAHRLIALGIFVFASLTDAFDGFLARVTSGTTDLGKFLDPLADKLLLVSGYLGLLFVHELPYTPPLWVTVTIVFRDIVLVIGMMTILAVTGKIRVQPNFLGKLTTVAQMITLMSVLLMWNYSFILWNLTAALTIVSCFTYLLRDFKKLGSS